MTETRAGNPLRCARWRRHSRGRSYSFHVRVVPAWLVSNGRWRQFSLRERRARSLFHVKAPRWMGRQRSEMLGPMSSVGSTTSAASFRCKSGGGNSNTRVNLA